MVNSRLFIRRLIRALTCWPKAEGWWFCAGVSAFAMAMIGVIAGLSGMVHWQPDFEAWPIRLAMMMLVPALSEELVFRGLLTPTRGEGRKDLWWMVAGLSAFVVWHVIEALTVLPGAAYLFLRPDFLLCTAVLGFACAVMRYRTGSLWPPVLLHGAIVFIWQAALGGPGFARLMAV